MPSTTALEFFNKRRKTTLYMENAKEENSSTKKKVRENYDDHQNAAKI